MHQKFVNLLFESIFEMASSKAEYDCNTYRKTGKDLSTFLYKFKSLLPNYMLIEVENWKDTEEVLTQIYFVLKIKKLCRDQTLC